MRTAAALLLIASAACSERSAATSRSTGPRPAPSAAAEPDRAPPRLRLSHDVRPIRYALDLTILPERPEFHGRVSIDAEAAKPVPIVWLNATELKVERASLNGQPARVVASDADFIGLSTGSPVAAGPLDIEVAYSGKIDREKSQGVYAEQEGDDWYAYTFFEPIDGRRAFPCFDQPDAKVPWRLTFHVRKDHVALANAPVESETPEAGGMKRVVIAESKPLPSYLVAFVVGPFEVVDGGTGGRVKTPIRFIIPKGRRGELRYARHITPSVVAALEDYFDMDYPYGKLDVAVVPRFWGTMEHPGIVAMGQPLTLIAPEQETRERKESYTNILAHELAHYWFGDLVTMAWWDDTWLNEAAGEWMDAIITDAAEPGWKFLDRRPELAAQAMEADEKLSTKAIRQPVDSKEAIQHSFDASITYMKGSTVLHMFETWVGEAKWRDFIRAYMVQHAWKNATADDFLAAMGARLGAPVAAAFQSFLGQPGVPVIEHRLVCEGSPRLELRQRRALPAGTREKAVRTWQVPVCVRYGAGAQARRSCVLLSGREGVLPLEGTCPKWLLMNAGGVGYYRSSYTKEEVAAVLPARSPARLTMAERRVLLSDVGAAVTRDELEIADAMALVPVAIANRDERIQRAAPALASALRPDILDDAAHARFRRWVLASYGRLARQLGWRRRRGDSDERHELRARVVSMAAQAGDRRLAAEASRLARAWLADRSAIEDDIVEAVLSAAAYGGDAALFDAILAAARAEKDDRTEQLRLVSALGGFRDPALVARALDLVLGKEFDLRETRGMLQRLLGARESRAQAWAFIQQHIDALLGGMRSDEASWFVRRTGVFCDAARRREVSALLGRRVAKIEGARYTLDQALDEIDQCIATQARIVPSATAYLARF
ncbi:MAG TPA: M1 family metallopeptidase [Kofleriaceae bacterium]|nr:M1 family metallopeptidase [Kofleriaceae bacterium]